MCFCYALLMADRAAITYLMQHDLLGIPALSTTANFAIAIASIWILVKMLIANIHETEHGTDNNNGKPGQRRSDQDHRK